MKKMVLKENEEKKSNSLDILGSIEVAVYTRPSRLSPLADASASIPLTCLLSCPIFPHFFYCFLFFVKSIGFKQQSSPHLAHPFLSALLFPLHLLPLSPSHARRPAHVERVCQAAVPWRARSCHTWLALMSPLILVTKLNALNS